MSGAAGSEEPEDLQIPQLIKQLCIVQTKDQLDRVSHLPAKRRRLLRSQLDISYDLLLGLRPDDAPVLNDQDALEVLVPEALAAVQDSLRQEEYPELADSLSSLLARLGTCTSCAVVGTPVEEVTGRPASVPLPDRTQLLAFLLSLQGSSASIRRRQATFQHQYETVSASSSSDHFTIRAPGDSSNLSTHTGPSLRSDIFLEAPDPHALFSLTGTSVLLPNECDGLNVSMHSSAVETNGDEIEDAEACMDARPVWAPASSYGVLSLAANGGGWIHIPKSLAKMGDNPGKTAPPPPPLGVPLGALAVDASPGSITTFQEVKGSRSPFLSPLLSSSGRKGLGAPSMSPVKSLAAIAAAAEKRKGNTEGTSDRPGSGGGPIIKWSEDSDLAKDVVQALQGVHSALLRLRGVLAAPHALPMPASAGLLRSVERAATLRQHIERFVATMTATKKDLVLVAFAVAVGDVLRQITEELSGLELGESLNGGTVTVNDGTGKIFCRRPISLFHTTTATKGVQKRIRSLALLCWSDSDPSQPNAPCEWEIQEPLAGVALLEYLFRQTQGADGPHQHTVQYLFARAAHPYLVYLRRWAFSTAPLEANDFYTTTASANSVDLSPPLHGDGDRTAPNVIKRRTATLVPGPLPAFLSHLQHSLMHAGTQLRLLHSVDCAQELLSELLALSPPLGSPLPKSAAVDEMHWLTLDPQNRIKNEEFSGGESADAELLMGSGQAHAALLVCANNDVSRANAVDLWLLNLKNERIQSEMSLKSEFTATVERLQDERIAADTSRMKLLERRRSVKAALMEDQLESLGAARLAKLGLTPGAPKEQPSVEEKKAGISSTDADGVAHIDIKVHEENDTQTITAGPLERRALLDALYSEEAPVSKAAPIPPTESPPTDPQRCPQGDALAPLSLALEALVGRSIHSQALVVSRACVGLFQDHLSLLNHLSFLRRTFFLVAGDWADAFLGPLAERVAALQPLDAHSVHNILQDALRTTSLENDPFAASLRVDLLPGPTAPSTFLSALEAEPGTAGALPLLPKGRAAAPVLVAPARLDGLDCLLLRYKTSWPLAAVLTEDTAVGYAAVFSAMLRVRKAGLLLKRLRLPLAARTRPAPAPSTRDSSASLGSDAVGAAEALMSSNAAVFAKAQQRLQQVRRFVHAASHFVAAVQIFQGACTSGPEWSTLATKVHPAAHPEIRCRDTQQLVDLHREYVHKAAADCLTFCGNSAAQAATENSLAAVLEVATLLQAAIVAGKDSSVSQGSAPRAPGKATWTSKLVDAGTWTQIESAMRVFDTASGQLRQALQEEGGSSGGPLSNLSAVLHM